MKMLSKNQMTQIIKTKQKISQTKIQQQSQMTIMALKMHPHKYIMFQKKKIQSSI